MRTPQEFMSQKLAEVIQKHLEPHESSAAQDLNFPELTDALIKALGNTECSHVPTQLGILLANVMAAIVRTAESEGHNPLELASFVCEGIDCASRHSHEWFGAYMGADWIEEQNRAAKELVALRANAKHGKFSSKRFSN